MTRGVRPWASDYIAMPPIRRKNIEGDTTKAAEIDHAWRKAAYEAIDRIIKNHYCPTVPAAARKHNSKAKLMYGAIDA